MPELQWSADGQVFTLLRQVRYKFTNPGGMQGLVVLSGKLEPRTWDQVHMSTDTSTDTDCVTTRPK